MFDKPSLLETSKKNLGDILTHAIGHAPAQKALVLYDTESPLTQIVTDGYRAHLPSDAFLDFADTNLEDIKSRFAQLHPGDLVVLVQSSNFRLNEFRIRIELFARGLKTIEHIHLSRIAENQYQTYLDALAYDPNYYRPLGHELKRRIDSCQKVIVECPGTKLVYDSPFEPAKLNIGDYSEMKNVGGTYPIGEVFSEPTELSRVNGEVRIFACANMNHIIEEFEPFTAVIKDGVLTAPDAPAMFKDVLAMIEEDSPVHVREFGLGLNPAMGKGRIVNDLTAFERMRGLHLSLGAKHSIYKKPGMSRKSGRYHVDVFVDLEHILIDEQMVYRYGDYLV